MLNLYKSNLNFLKPSRPTPNANLAVDFHTVMNVVAQKEGPHAFKMKSKRVREKQQNMINNITISNQHELLSDMVTPCWKLSYDQELEMKQKNCEDIVREVLSKVSPNNTNDIHKIVDKIIASPVRDAYRNNDEFSVWSGLDGNPKTVGFFVGSPAVGKVVCVPPTHLKCIRESHKNVAQLYQDLIQNSPLPVSYQLYDGGFWRNIIVRSNSAGDHLALVVTLPGNRTPEEIAVQENIMKEYFTQHIPNISLFHQSCRHVKCTREQAPLHHLSGKPFLTETLGGLSFRLSPDSFFQRNTPAAKLLFDTVLKMARLKHYTTLLDLYCGTGAISLFANKIVRSCVGVDEATAAIEDAKYSAQLNDITNCDFFPGRVELKLSRVLKDLDHVPEMVAIVNPGRGGAGEGVISMLRHNRHIHRVVYVSCKPDNPLTKKNFVQLCERVSSDSRPFQLTKAVPVDLFPYTNQCELALCFDKT